MREKPLPPPKYLAIDAGSTESGYCVMNAAYQLIEHGKLPNSLIAERLRRIDYDMLVLEMIASYGMPVGAEVFETCVWIGRFTQIANDLDIPVARVYRKEEKICLCGSMKAKDANIRQALIDRFARFDFKNGRGTKKNPDYFYGVSKDEWSAVATATVQIDKERGVWE